MAVSGWTSCSSSSGEERVSRGEQCPPKLPGFFFSLSRSTVCFLFTTSKCLFSLSGNCTWDSGYTLRFHWPKFGARTKDRLKIGTTFKDVVIRHRRIITSLFPVVKIATLDQQVGILYLKSRLLFSCKNDGNSGTCSMWMDLLVIMQMK